MLKYLFTCLLLEFCSTNLILNGDFELPHLSTNYLGCPQNWNCKNHILIYRDTIFITQFSQIGKWISQNVTVNQSGNYQLVFFTKSFPGTINKYLWNNIPQLIVNETSQSHQKINLTINIDKGFGILNFTTSYYVFVDNISLTIKPPPPPPPPPSNNSPTTTQSMNTILPKQTCQKLGLTLSLPISSVPIFYGIYFLLGDCWLFIYTTKKYKGSMSDMFYTIQQIENSKLEGLLTKTNLNASILQISNYANFTDPKFVEISQSSSVLIEAIFSFLVFSVPSTSLACLFFYLVFILSKRYQKIRKMFRHYYLLKEMIIFSLLDQNIDYFIYVCSGHLEMAFFFKFADKLSFIFTIIIGFTLTTFTFVFYLFLGRYNKNFTKKLNSNVRRGLQGHTLLTIKGPFRSLIRGILFYYLKKFYVTQMLIMSSFEFSLLLIIILMNNRRIVPLFEKKIWFCLSILNHLFFSVLHFILALDEISSGQFPQYPENQNFFLLFEKSILFLMAGGILSGMIIEILPLSWLEKQLPDPQKNQQKSKEQSQNKQTLNTQNQSIKKIEIKDKEKQSNLKKMHKEQRIKKNMKRREQKYKDKKKQKKVNKPKTKQQILKNMNSKKRMNNMQNRKHKKQTESNFMKNVNEKNLIEEQTARQVRLRRNRKYQKQVIIGENLIETEQN